MKCCENLSYHAMVEIVDGRRYGTGVAGPERPEERERVLFAVVLVGFVLSLALAVFSAGCWRAR